MLLLLYSIVVTPYRISFVDVDTVAWMGIDTTVDFLFFFDLVISCVLVYQDEERNLVTSHRAIMVRYLKSWFVIDLASCVPLQLILDTQINVNNLVRLARVSRIYKLARMCRIMRMVKFIKNRHQIIRYMNQVFLISLSVERLFWFVVTLIIMLHLVACGWVFIGRFNMDTDSNNWITTYGFADLTNPELYIVSMYWTVTTVATVGYGDIHACNQEEMVVNCVVMLLGVCIYSYMIGALTNLISSLDSRKAKLNQKLELLRELGKEYGLSKTFLEKLASAVEYEHKNTNKDIDELVSTLPNSLKNQLLVTIYQKKIESNAFFEGRTDHFVAWIAPYLKPFRFDEQEIVYHEGDLANEMYFLVKGGVEFVLDKENEYVCYVSVSPNYYFGEIDLLFSPNKLRQHTTKTSTRTELLSLSREIFEKMLKTFENEAYEILSLSRERSIRIDERRVKAEAEYQATKQVSRHFSIPVAFEDRKRKIQTLKNEIEKEQKEVDESSSMTEEDPEATDRRISLIPDDDDGEKPKFSRLNTFGDTEYTRFTQKLKKSKAITRANFERTNGKRVSDVGNREIVRHIEKLEAGLTHVTNLLEKLTSKPGKRPNFQRGANYQIPEMENESEESQEISDLEDGPDSSPQ